jgi:hypothetical protein
VPKNRRRIKASVRSSNAIAASGAVLGDEERQRVQDAAEERAKPVIAPRR